MTKELAVIIVQINNQIEVSLKKLMTIKQLQQLFSQEATFTTDLLENFILSNDNILEKIFLHVYDSYISLEIDSIIKCEASGNYTKFYTDEGKEYLVSKPLKYYDNFFSKKYFFRASRSTLVNMKFVQSIYKKEAIILSTGEKIIVSSRNKNKLLSFILDRT